MSKKKLDLFIPITKVDEEQRLVYGCLAQEELDNSGEVFDYASSKPNFEKWSADQFKASNGLSKGNVRSMHTSIASGKLTDMSFDDANKKIEGCAKVIDDNEWKKVLEGVYTGFSMGGRYEKRWQENGETRYTAIPVEMSLVDKPCISSAVFGGMVKHDTFTLMKADGSVEERAFKSVGADEMYVPTNDEILPVAKALAKADGKDETAWLDYVQPATDQIIAEKGDNPFADKGKDEAAADDGDKPEHTDEDCKAGDDCDKCAEKAAKAVDAPVAKVDDPGEDSDTGGEGPEGEAVAKVTPAGIVQLWTASDGKGFVKKGDCIAHEDALAKAASGEQSLTDMLKAAAANVATLASGEQVPDGIETTGEPLDVRADKMAKFLLDPQVVEKSIYNVSRTADALQNIGSLYRSVSAEAGREADGSGIPASLMEIVEKLGGVLIDMATEEVGEMMTRFKSAPEGGVAVYDDYYCELAASTLGLEKADANEFFAKAISVSDSDLARIQKIHDHSIALGAECAEGGDADTADAEVEAEAKKMAKAAGFESPVEHLKDQLAKRDQELTELAPLVKSLADDVQRLMALPRASAPRLNVVSKGDEGGTTGIEQTPVQKAVAALAGLPPEELAREAFKLSFQNGRSVNLS